MEKAVLNVKALNITQGMNGSYSHKGDLAIDMGYACEWLRAPFTGVIKRKYANCNAVWLESCEKVEYADGTKDYMTVLTIHDNDISNLKVGQVIKQGDVYYQPGTKGNATGSHIHISICKGKFSGTGWYKNKYGSWCSNNQYDITKALFLYSGVKIKNKMYNWKTTKDFGSTTKYLNLKPSATTWSVYNNSKLMVPLTRKGYVKPSKFGGLTYKILGEYANYHYKIQTDSYGTCYIAGNPNKYPCTITASPLYKNGNY